MLWTQAITIQLVSYTLEAAHFKVAKAFIRVPVLAMQYQCQRDINFGAPMPPIVGFLFLKNNTPFSHF